MTITSSVSRSAEQLPPLKVEIHAQIVARKANDEELLVLIDLSLCVPCVRFLYCGSEEAVFPKVRVGRFLVLGHHIMRRAKRDARDAQIASRLSRTTSYMLPRTKIDRNTGDDWVGTKLGNSMFFFLFRPRARLLKNYRLWCRCPGLIQRQLSR